MKYRNYIDCREGSRTKLAEASRHLVAALGATGPEPAPGARTPRRRTTRTPRPGA